MEAVVIGVASAELLPALSVVDGTDCCCCDLVLFFGLPLFFLLASTHVSVLPIRIHR